MEHDEHEVYASREHKQSRYDKRLILKIVKEVENGLPRKEANRIYGLGVSRLILSYTNQCACTMLKTFFYLRKHQ